MIQLFEIKKKVKQMKNTDKELLEKYTEISKKNKEEILREYNTKEDGLTQKEYEKRYENNGPNIVVKNEKKKGETPAPEQRQTAPDAQSKSRPSSGTEPEKTWELGTAD